MVWVKIVEIKVIIICIVVFIVSFFFFSFIIRPFDNEITQNKPTIKLLCKLQASCHSVKGPYTCSDAVNDPWTQRLGRWKGFKGCNNMTEGYQSDNSILIEYCSCGGWM